MRRILVADDSSMNRMILGKILEDKFEVTEASDGYEALHIMQKECGSISAVLLDLEMPSMNGFEVMQAMREDDSLFRIPVIVCSASDDYKTQEKIFDCGAAGFVAKPYNAAIIINLLRSIIRISRSGPIDCSTVKSNDIEISQWMDLAAEMQSGKIEIYEFNLTRDVLVRHRGDLFPKNVLLPTDSFDSFLCEWAKAFVMPDDIDCILEFCSRSSLLSMHGRGMLDCGIDYRAVICCKTRQCSLNIRFVSYEHDRDVRIIMVHTDLQSDTEGRSDSLTAGRQSPRSAYAEECVVKDQHFFERQTEDGKYCIAIDSCDTVIFEWNALTGSFAASPDFLQYAVSEQAAESFFSEKSDLSGIHPDDRPLFYGCFLEKVLSGDAVKEISLRLKLKKGGYRLCRLSAVVFVDGEDLQKVIGVIN